MDHELAEQDPSSVTWRMDKAAVETVGPCVEVTLPEELDVRLHALLEPRERPLHVAVAMALQLPAVRLRDVGDLVGPLAVALDLAPVPVGLDRHVHDEVCRRPLRR